MNNNETLIPDVQIGANYYDGGNRTVDVNNSKAGVLEEIIYPTGGKVIYSYESNTASDINSEFSTYYNLKNRLKNKYVFLNKSSAYENSDGVSYSTNFTVSDSIVGKAKIEITTSGCDSSLEPGIHCDYTFQLIGISDPSYIAFIGINEADRLDLPPGEYKVSAIETGIGLNQEPSFSLKITWGVNPNPLGGINVGGLRVKKITLISSDDLEDKIIKHYNYNDNGISSGTVIGAPVFVNTKYFNGGCIPGKNVYKLTSNSQTTSLLSKGNIVGYGLVTESLENEAKTEFTFSVGTNYFDPYSRGGDIVYLPPLNTSWLSGQLLKKVFYEYKNNEYIKKNKETYEYESIEREIIPYAGVKIENTISGAGFATFNYAVYSEISEYNRLKEKISYNYFTTDSVVQIETNHYLNNKLIPYETSTINSKEDIIKTVTKYAYDINDQGLVDAHRIIEPLETITYKNGVQLSHQKTVYSENHNTTDLYLPKEVQTLRGIPSATNEFETRVIYHKYDAKGNPVEVSKAGGTRIVYIWGYNDTYPVAKIENATLADIPEEIITDLQTKSNNDSNTASEATLQIALNTLRSMPSLSKALVTTYTYDPLIGVTSITDPRGETMYYEYDDFNRLVLIKDAQRNIVKEHKYNYKN